MRLPLMNSLSPRLARRWQACDGGLDYRAYDWMLKHGGEIATEATYPYLNADG